MEENQYNENFENEQQFMNFGPEFNEQYLQEQVEDNVWDINKHVPNIDIEEKINWMLQ